VTFLVSLKNAARTVILCVHIYCWRVAQCDSSNSFRCCDDGGDDCLRWHKPFRLRLRPGPTSGAAAAVSEAAGTRLSALVMTISAFPDGTDIPETYTQAGDQTSPAITWTPSLQVGNVPSALHDLEGPEQDYGDQLHWLVWRFPHSNGTPKAFQWSALATAHTNYAFGLAFYSRSLGFCWWRPVRDTTTLLNFSLDMKVMSILHRTPSKLVRTSSKRFRDMF